MPGEEEGGAPVSTIAEGAETTIPNTDLPAPAPEFASLIPAEYKDSSVFADIKDIPSLFKFAAETKAMVGQRPNGIPQDTAPAEEWAAFHKALGKPDAPEGYKFAELPEGKEVHEDFRKGFSALLHKADVTQKQLIVLEPGFDELAAKLSDAEGVAGEQANTDFDKLAADTFGTREDQVMKNGKALIDKYIPENMRELQSTISNENLMILAGVLDGIAKDYIREDQIPDGGAPVGAMTKEDKITEATNLTMTEAYENWQHPEHKTTVAKVNQLFGNA